MKRILIFMAALAVFAACQVEPTQRFDDGEYLVYTAPGKDADFTQYKTFTIADSLLVIGQSPKPVYSQSGNAMSLIYAFIDNMKARGYEYVEDASDADLGLQLTLVVETQRFVQYYNNPYWWLDYPGYWAPNYWGNWYDFHYSRPVTYTYTTNALLADMVDKRTELSGEEKPLEIVWSSYIGGLAVGNDVNRLKNAIDQAFIQSTYLNIETK